MIKLSSNTSDCVQGSQGLQKAVSKRLSLDTEGGLGSPEPEELSAFNIEDDINMRVRICPFSGFLPPEW